MYVIKPQSIKTFIEDTSIKLPRFQRKQTWNEEKNFLLAVSIFKRYPLGVTILNIEKEGKGKTTKWLLDGRQRRYALTEMYYDPEKIYFWAKKYIKFKNSSQIDEVIAQFVDKVMEYIEQEYEIDSSNISGDPEVEEISDKGVSPVSDNEIDENVLIKNTGLNLLAKLIKLTHNKRVKGTGLTRQFDFSQYFKNIYYIEQNGNLSCRKLKSWAKQYDDYCIDNLFEHDKKESFVLFLESRFQYIDVVNSKKQFDSKLALIWKDILERLELFQEIDKTFLDSNIGLIEISDITTTDSQKIFNIINTGGTMLTAAEILSAKPSWNIILLNISDELIRVTKKLYDEIGSSNQDIVRWDLPATLLYRLENMDYILGDFKEDNTGFEKRVGFGFKILSGIYEKGVKKEDIDKLSVDNKINWNTDIEKTISDLNILFKLISESSFFKYLQSWKTNIRSLLSDATVLNFIFLIYQDWINKGKTTSDNNAKKVQKNAYILFDRMVYEYVSKQWRGSSDSKIAKNMKDFNLLQNEGIFIKIENDKWEKLIKNILDNNKIEDDFIDQLSVTPLIYYYYCLCEVQGPDVIAEKIEVDHIIPKTLFVTSTIPNCSIIKDNIFNLALLPKKDNISKSNKVLSSITDSWLKSQIVKYEEIAIADFAKYSDINNYLDLKKHRGNKIKEAYSVKRDEWMNNIM